jgi:hypothetical protein
VSKGNPARDKQPIKMKTPSITVSGKYGPQVVSLSTNYGRFRASCMVLARVAEFAKIRAVANKQFLLACSLGAVAGWGRYPTASYNLDEQIARLRWLRAQIEA